jgi:hypothetical protein
VICTPVRDVEIVLVAVVEAVMVVAVAVDVAAVEEGVDV